MLKRAALGLFAAFLVNLVSKYDDECKVPAKLENISDCVPYVNISSNAPRYWLSQKLSNQSHIFQSIEKVLIKLGLEKAAPNDVSSIDTIHYDWDFLWTFQFFDYLPLNFSRLEYYQKINHIPGGYSLNSKSVLSSTTVSKYIPRGFMNKAALQKFASENPGVRFVEKNKANRGVNLKTVDEMDFKEGAGFLKEFFAQVFVEDPFLLDGHKFDFNIYVIITSVNPLRVYYYSKNIYVRVCRLPYNPNDFSEPDSYVISDAFIPGFEFPPIKKYFEKGFTYKEAFDQYFIEQGHDPKAIYDQVEDAIQTIVSSKEPKMIEFVNKLGAKYGKLHFVEMFRFDFLIDAKFNLHLMEVNQSPNLYANHKIRHNRHLMESAIYNYLNLVGVGSYLKKRYIRKFELDEEDFLCHDNSISVMPELCMRDSCSKSCNSLPECQLCMFCMTSSLKYDFKLAYLEQMNSGDMKRVIPPPYVIIARDARKFLTTANDSYWNQLSPMNKLFSKWSLEMCKKNRHFC